jgi:hypothetical protein
VYSNFAGLLDIAGAVIVIAACALAAYAVVRGVRR